MERFIMQDLIAWKNRKDRKPLILLGARQVGKTYILKENSQLELDFVIQAGVQVIPVEVKAEENLQSKSLKVTIAKYPSMKGLRFSMSDYREQDDITNVPLYGARGYLTNVTR